MAKLHIEIGTQRVRGRWRAVQRRYLDGRLEETVVIDPKGVDGFDTEDQAYGWALRVAAASERAMQKLN